MPSVPLDACKPTKNLFRTLVSSSYWVSDLLFLQPIYHCPVLRVVGNYVPLVVVGGQRDLGDTLRGDLVPPRPEGVKPCMVR